MTKSILAALVALSVPVAALATPVSIDWSGQITDYVTTPDSGAPPAPLSMTDVSGTISYDTDLLPTADSGNPPGLFSLNGNSFLGCTVHWAGGVFQTGQDGDVSADSLFIDTIHGQLSLTGSGAYLDAMGDSHSTLFIFGITGLPDALTASFGLGSGGGLTSSGGGNLLDINARTQGGYVAAYQIERLSVSTMAAPEMDATGTASALTLLAGCLAVARGRRTKMQPLRSGTKR